MNLKARFALTAVAGMLVASATFAQSTATQFASTATAGATARPVPPQPQTGLHTSVGPLDPEVVARIVALEKAWDKYDTDKAAGNTAAVAVDESAIFATYAAMHEQRKAFRKMHAAAARGASAAPASNVPQ